MPNWKKNPLLAWSKDFSLVHLKAAPHSKHTDTTVLNWDSLKARSSAGGEVTERIKVNHQRCQFLFRIRQSGKKTAKKKTLNLKSPNIYCWLQAKAVRQFQFDWWMIKTPQSLKNGTAPCSLLTLRVGKPEDSLLEGRWLPHDMAQIYFLCLNWLLLLGGDTFFPIKSSFRTHF